MDPKSCSKSTNVCESSSGSVLEAVIVVDVKGETNGSVSNHVLIKEQNENKPQQGKEDDSRVGKYGVRCSNSSTNAVHEEVVGTVTAVSCNEAGSDASTKAKTKEFHTVDLSGGGESDLGQRICRICHFGSDQSPDRVSGKSVSPDLVEIGCKCKNELGLAHSHCAEAWFKLRGNSVCEICGCTAKNVTVRLTEEEWSEVRETTLDERRRGSGQSCCIFMVFLLTVILLHWFFKKISSYYRNTSNL
ncbi:hypothetical protein EUTSA_v10017163mg [Eutrema salsugineum]|uniref:RING-CH-type domain-containing protein n=1 Tax=Eutrema salsugineum TaxID=72664 RepID=V4LNB5_EUTSA|nr:E3 ubiquitin-protein ligase MARCH8 [Eutrema salsugineum]XP_024003905.1 E3 ubiquitin-protein ligase MARCH8 [Eutrema salsugineum]ESQ52015.1 hypothetical protein EUTSA_v10017163mg [Eutrema salsugineum]